MADTGFKDTPDSGFKDTRDTGFGPGGSVCWGHDTGVVEDSVRDFLNNWSGDAAIAGIEDNEQLVFDSGEYMESETWYAGAGRIRLLTNKYIYVLSFDAQTGSFTAGNTIIGATSGATATIVGVYQSGGIGSLYLTNIVGTFQNNEIIYESALGSELVTNGDFANWTGDNPDNWTISGESGSDPMITEVAGACRLYTSSAYITMRQAILTLNNFYLASFDIDAADAGGLSMRNGDTYINTYTTIGSKTDVFRADDSSWPTWFSFQRNGIPVPAAADFTFDDVSVKQITNAALANGVVAAFSEGTPVVKYKQGASQALCEADSWHAYTIPFVCGGWVKIRLECT